VTEPGWQPMVRCPKIAPPQRCRYETGHFGACDVVDEDLEGGVEREPSSSTGSGTEDARISEIRALLADFDAIHPLDFKSIPSLGSVMDRLRTILDSKPELAEVRVFRYTKSNFKPVEMLPVYRVYPDGCVTRQQHGDVERGARNELEFLEHEVLHGRMAETAEPLPGGGRS
jgi:hypothetical protein